MKSHKRVIGSLCTKHRPKVFVMFYYNYTIDQLIGFRLMKRK